MIFNFKKAVTINNGIIFMIGLAGVPMIILSGKTTPQSFIKR